ncbi:MAG: hypothetical protein Kow0056_13500 [Coriobacteriia bacterium]
MDQKLCAKCGAALSPGDDFCGSCGIPASPDHNAAQAPTHQAQAHPDQQPQQYPAGQQYQQPYPSGQQYQQPQYPQQPYGAPPQYPQQPYGTPPQYPQPPYGTPQYPQQPKKSGAGKTIAIILGILLLLGACGAGALVLFGMFGPDGGGGGGKDVVQWEPTYDQLRVIDEFGVPQAFMVAYGEDPEEDLAGEGPPPIHRVETWDYWEIGTRFRFKDGVALGVDDLPDMNVDDVFGADITPYTPAFSPLDFSYGMSPEQVADFMQVGPSKTAEIQPDLFDGLTMDSFFDELYVTYENGGLIAVEAPLLDMGGGE